jgi:hypothetical protein
MCLLKDMVLHNKNIGLIFGFVDQRKVSLIIEVVMNFLLMLDQFFHFFLVEREFLALWSNYDYSRDNWSCLSQTLV